MKMRVYYNALDTLYYCQYKLFGLFWRNFEFYDVFAETYPRCYEELSSAMKFINDKAEEIRNIKTTKKQKKSKPVYYTQA